MTSAPNDRNVWPIRAVQSAVLELTAERDAAVVKTDFLSRQMRSQQEQLLSLQSQMASDAAAQSASRAPAAFGSEEVVGRSAGEARDQGAAPPSPAEPLEPKDLLQQLEEAAGAEAEPPSGSGIAEVRPVLCELIGEPIE